MNQLFEEIEETVAVCLVKDQFSFSRRLKKLRQLHRNGKDIQRDLRSLKKSIDRSTKNRSGRLHRIPQIDYSNLPVSEKRDEIAQAILANQVVIVCGETGSGKTTQLPKICLSIGRGCAGFIGHTQPRRLAASTVAKRIAEELGQAVGDLVGYKVRFQDKSNAQTLVKLMTDGILLAEIQGDPYLNEYDTLILDEAHERSLNIDFLLGYLKGLLPKRPDLKLIVTSATIDPDRFARHFDGAPVIEVSGRTYPVEMRYRPIDDSGDEPGEGDFQRAFLAAVDELSRCQDGDILVFLSGEREIRENADLLRKHFRDEWEILPLFSRLSGKEQERIFSPGGERRIVLSTNVAETSLTVPGIRCVIDSGLARISRYSYRSKIQRLPIEKISQASANQRAGRCGRLGPGICIRLFSEEDFQARPEYTDPEILRTNLAAVILQMKSLRLAAIEQFPFIDAPDPRMIRDGLKLLDELNAIDPEKRLTRIGWDLVRIPLDPRLSRMVVAAKEEKCLTETAIIVSALSIQDPRERPADKTKTADEKHRQYQDKESDFLSFIHLWKAVEENIGEWSNSKFRKYCRENFLSYRRLREWRDIHSQLMKIVRTDLRFKANRIPADYESIHRALLSGLLSNVGFRQDQSEYLGARNLKFYIHPGSGLFKVRPKWILAGEQVETGRVYGRSIAKITPEWIEKVAAHLIRLQHFDPHWQKRQGRVAVHEKSVLFGLTLQKQRKIPFERIDPAGAREIFIRCALVEQDFNCNAEFFKHNRELLEKLGYLQHKGRRADLIADDEILFRFFDERIPETVVDGNSFNRWRRQVERTQPDLLKLTREEISGIDERSVDAEQYPDHLNSGTTTVQLEYRFEPGHAEDGVTAIIPLHQLNQVSAEAFEWLVPGFLNEKVVALIKSLPKSIRRNFVPAPDYADRFLRTADRQSSLLKSLAAYLSAMKPVDITENNWLDCSLANHLLMNFRIVGEKSRIMATSRDFPGLQVRFENDSKQVFHSLVEKELLQSGCSRWEFGELPRHQTLVMESGRTLGYPALVDEGKTVGLRLFDSPVRADAAHEFGMVRLIVLQMRGEMKYLQKMIRGGPSIVLGYRQLAVHPFPQTTVAERCGDFNTDLAHLIIRTVFLEGAAKISSQAEFQNRLAEQKHRLVETAESLSELVANIFRLAAEIRGKLERLRTHPTIADDLNEQLSLLIYKGFMTTIPCSSLKSYPRYLKAILHRIDRIGLDPSRDLKQLKELEPVWTSYWTWVKNSSVLVIPDTDDYRWRLEEFRVSLFAQSLKTAYPVSRKRLEKLWATRCSLGVGIGG